jgi:hypothetical protein
MKNAILLLVIVALISGCGGKPSIKFDSAEVRAERARQDSIALADSLSAVEAEMNKSAKRYTKESFEDTTGLSKSPVIVTRAVFFQEQYSSFYSVRLNYKNVSGKTISAIRFEWYGENAFGEPADMSGGISGYGGGFTDEPLKSGASRNSFWSILSRDGKKVIGARAYEVAFADGSKWAR